MYIYLHEFVQKIHTLIKEALNNSSDISKINSGDIPEVLEICAKVFANVMSPNNIKKYIQQEALWSICMKATVDNKIVGCYIFNEQSVFQFQDCSDEDLTNYRDLRGIQGVALAVLPEFRDTGICKKLRDYLLHMNYDYIWGQHLHGLQNVDKWVKFGRRVVGDCGGLTITLMDLKNNNTISERVENNNTLQQQGHTCGPTCVQMVADYLGVSYESTDQIENLCNCNTTTGTIDTGIKNALDTLGIKNEQNTKHKNPKDAINYLNNHLNSGNVFIMRTLTKGIKHWIIVYKFLNNEYYIADPWLGKIKYSEQQLLNIWNPRDFDGFAIF